MAQIGFIGAGRMAEAMILGMLSQGALTAASIGCVSGSGHTARELSARTGIQYFPTPEALAGASETWVLALKPYQLDDLPPSLAHLSKGKLIISVLAGVRLERLRAKFPYARNIVRAMPNTPSQIGQGITGYTFLAEPWQTDAAQVELILGAAGEILQIPETEMDALTALSGSGVAYVFNWAQAMIDAGIAEGLSPETAKRLVLATFSGASALMQASSDLPPSALRDAVVSKGGTTEAALNVFAENQTVPTVHRAVHAAAERSRELSRLDD